MNGRRIAGVAASAVFLLVSGFTLGRQYGGAEATPEPTRDASLQTCERVRDYGNQLRRYSATDRDAWFALVRLATEYPECGI